MTTPQPIIEKLRKLMRLSSSDNEHEAALAAERMQALMQEHNLTRADVDGEDTGPEDPTKVEREEKRYTGSAIYKYQQSLMETIAENNFCIYVLGQRRVYKERGKFWEFLKDRDGNALLDDDGTRIYRRYNRVKCHVLFGRSENVTAATLTYEYLLNAMDRVSPYKGTGKRSSDAMLWLQGCADRLCERLVKQRTGAEIKRDLDIGGTPGLVRLSDLYGSERDLNEDFRRGVEPGTTARERREREAEAKRIEEETERLKALGHCWEEAWYMARGWTVPDAVPRKMERETPEQEAARKAAQAKRDKEVYSGRGGRTASGWTQKDQREWDRKNSSAYRAGRRGGDEIGLGGEVGSGKRGLLK